MGRPRLSDAASGNRRPFTLSGSVTHWIATTRELSIRGQDLVLTPFVPTGELALGLEVVVAGYHDPSTGQMVVTRLLLA